MADYTIENIYQGGYSGLNPRYGSVLSGYGFSAQGLGMSTDARTANVLKEASQKVSSGAKALELTQVFPNVFDAVPQEQLKEVDRLAQLAGVEISLHAPLVEPSGLTKEGFSEDARRQAERQMLDAIKRAEVLNSKGNLPITFHSSAQLPGEVLEKGKKTPEEVLIIDKETHKIAKLPLKERKFPGEKASDRSQEIKQINEDVWGHQIRDVAYYAELGSEAISGNQFQKAIAEAKIKHGISVEDEEKLKQSAYNRGATFLNESYRNLKSLFDMAYRNSPESIKTNIERFYSDIQKDAEKIKSAEKAEESINLRKKIIDKGIDFLKSLDIPPQMYIPLEDYARDKTCETFGNVAWETYARAKKENKPLPIISIENPPIGSAFAKGSDLKEIVEESKKRFVQKAVENGVSESTAKKDADKLIGVTWDVGHINMLRKYGYTSEDIVKETEAVAKLVKHVHLSDNFGFEHTELPMGMGNVPIKEIMEKLGKEGFKGKKVIEALDWWQHFSDSGKVGPLQPTLEYFTSPMSSSGKGPYWSQTPGFSQGYYSGFGPILPEMNYQSFGAGFSRLPAELGGNIQTTPGSRLGGTPLE